MVGVSFLKERLTETRAKILARDLEKIDREYERELLRVKYLGRFRKTEFGVGRTAESTYQEILREISGKI
ncbi:MAG: hypothetical protein QXG98_00625 [Candidatus Micrarchaeia archaeon]